MAAKQLWVQEHAGIYPFAVQYKTASVAVTASYCKQAWERQSLIHQPNCGPVQVVDDAVKTAVHGAVQGAVQQVLVSHSKLDVRANTLTLIAITGVIIFWRGIWTMW